MSARVAGATRFQSWRLFFFVHENRALQPELPILKHDRVLVLSDPVDWPIKRPVKNNAGCLAAETRIIFALEIARRLFSGRRQFRSTKQPRTARNTAASSATGRAF